MYIITAYYNFILIFYKINKKFAQFKKLLIMPYNILIKTDFVK